MQAGPSIPHANGASAQPRPAGMNVDDILFTLFRHKQMILACFIVGAIGAALVRAFYPPVFFSEAKVNVPYVVKQLPGGPIDPDAHVQLTDARGEMILGTEMEILKSFSIASNAAAIVGPERVLAKLGGGSNIYQAAYQISSRIEVNSLPGRSSTLTIFYFHPDPTVVQPVLNAFIEAYKIRHFNLYRKSQFDDAYYQNRMEAMRSEIAILEKKIRDLQLRYKVLSVDDTKKEYQARLLALEEQLGDARRELAERQSIMGDTIQLPSNGQSTNALPAAPPTDAIEEYRNLSDGIAMLKKQLGDLQIKEGLKDAHPIVMNVRGHLDSLLKKRESLTNSYPALASMTFGAGSGTNSGAASALSDLAEIKRLTARVAWLEKELTDKQTDAAHIIEIEPILSSLREQLALDRTNYQIYVREFESARTSETVEAGKQVGIGMVEEPTPPSKNTKKIKKLLGAVFGGFSGLGLGLAFLIDMFLDRSIKRGIDIERKLHLPVLQCIPDTAWSGRPALPWLSLAPKNGNGNGAGHGENGHAQGSVAMWDPVGHLHPYTEGLRERLMTYFEGNNLERKRPKLVGVTACARGSGVTTLSRGLAASLSRVGTGNVLFVDMNGEQGSAHQFQDGDRLCDLPDALASQRREDAQVEQNLYVACIPQKGGEKAKAAAPNGLAQLMPQISASDYDYVIFDFPPVSQTNSTARLAGYMDLTLLVVEAEKTAQQSAVKANGLMTDARARVAAVLNKCHKYVPERISQDL
jgi:succinoglycan biosynthesis transport protein ExoP